jgi:hypothetical protein
MTCVWLPEAARRAGLRKGGEVVTSRNHQWIDRPLLPERSPSERLVSGTRGQAGPGGHASVRGGLPPRQMSRPPPARRPPRGGPCGSHRGHGNSGGARPDALPRTATTAGQGRYKAVEHGRCLVGTSTRLASRNRSGPAADTTDSSAVAVRPAVKVPDTMDGRPRPVSARPMRRLREPLAGSAAAGGMQPTPMEASQSRGQAAAELAADIGHRRPGERAGLLEA